MFTIVRDKRNREDEAELAWMMKLVFYGKEQKETLRRGIEPRSPAN
jgi:hypothetical protein